MAAANPPGGPHGAATQRTWRGRRACVPTGSSDAGAADVSGVWTGARVYELTGSVALTALNDGNGVSYRSLASEPNGVATDFQIVVGGVNAERLQHTVGPSSIRSGARPTEAGSEKKGAVLCCGCTARR